MNSVIVTGASRGIGAAICRALMAHGCRVIGISRSEEALRLISMEKIGPGRFEYVAGDVCDSSVLKAAVEKAASNASSLVGIVLNAGTVAPIEKCSNISMEEFRKAFEVNMFSAVNLCQLAIPHLRACNGKIIFTSTGVAELPMTAWSPYCSSKAAMNMYLKCLAQEEPEITCVSVRPGIVDTAITQEIYSDSRVASVMDPNQFKFMEDQKSQGRVLQPFQPASVMAKLVLKAPKSLSGQFLAWDDARLKNL